MLAQMQRLLTTPGMIARTCNAVRAEDTAIGGRDVLGVLTDAGGLWTELSPAEQALIMRLLVERVAFSDDLVRTAMASLVRSLGLAAHTFAGADEFLQSPRLDDTGCLILDVQMPGTSGLELQELLAARGCRLPVIFITAHPEERIRDQALAAGAVCFLSKPYVAQEVILMHRSALRAGRPADAVADPDARSADLRLSGQCQHSKPWYEFARPMHRQ